MPGDFNGTSSLVTVSTPTGNLKGAKTIRVRFFLDALPAANAYLFAANAASSSTGYAMFCTITSTGQLWILRCASGWLNSLTNSQYSNTGAGVVTAGQWNEAVFVFTGTFAGDGSDNCLMYLNGVLQASTAEQAGVGTECELDGLWMIGGHSGVGSRFVNGRIDGVKVYSGVAWTQTDVTNSYQGIEPGDTGRVWEPNLAGGDATVDLAGLQTATTSNVTYTNNYPQWGLQAWFRADTVTGNPISAMADRSGNGADLAQATSGNRPALYSGTDWSTALVQNTDYDSAAGAEKHTCLDKATGSGPVFNSRNMTVFVVAGSVLSGTDNAPHNEQTLISLGDPATGSTGIFDFSITPPGDIAIRRTKATTQTLSSTVYMTANPRVYAVRCNSTNVKLFNELRSETLTALTADTATGIRVGATPGTIDNAWMGDWAEILIYSKDMTDAQVQAEIARLQTAYGLTTPTKQLLIEGSSSATGYRSTDCRGLVRPMYRLNSGLLIHNDATGSNTFTDFDADIANLAAIAGGNDLPTYILAWLGANDLSTVSDNGATVYTDLTDWIAAARADATLGPLLRNVAVVTILVNGTNTTRETSRQTYNTAIRGGSGYRVVDIAALPDLIPAGNNTTDLGIICGGPLYGDVTHLDDDGFAYIQTTIVGSMRQMVVGRTTSLAATLAALGMV